MKFIDEFRDGDLARGILKRIEKTSKRPVQLMEVCGTHTVSIFRSGLRNLLPEQVRLLSGPGCPVCVTPNQDIDLGLALARQNGTILLTFGDMMKVPGSRSSLQKEKAEGRDIRMIYSSLDLIRIARENPTRRVVFFAIGFETTTPTISVAIRKAKEEGIRNLFILNSQKRIPPALSALLKSNRVKVDGFLLPGHVSTILGVNPYRFIVKEFGKACVIAGFEPLDILQGIYMLLRQIEEERPEVEIQYRRVVEEDGNARAREAIAEVFEVDGALWRGLGPIPESGYRFKEAYADLDARSFDIEVEPSIEHPECLCGEVIQGVRSPLECRLFGTVCHPEEPVGPCMVSFEGTCHTYYRFPPERSQ
ncbi:MAG: hydrogenase formation protein HypD [Desulfobacterota bacterium]|nr:hydrogenase formation protein HypD [Thermodesulfobacteriota bacterium]